MTAPWFIEASKKVEALGNLRRGWDSYAGEPLDARVKAIALDVIGWLSNIDLPAPDVSLPLMRCVHLEWRNDARELEIEIGRKGIHVTVCQSGAVEECDIAQGETCPAELRGMALWFLTGQVPARGGDV